MYNKKSIFELATNGLLPFVTVILVALVNFVSFGFTLPDKGFYIDTIVNTIALLGFFLPFKTIFVDKYMTSERIANKRAEYVERVNRVYENKIDAFNHWCAETNFEKRKKEFLDRSLKLVGIGLEEFNANYLFKDKAIKENKSLNKIAKDTLLNINKKLPKIKQVNVYDVLPSTDNITVFTELNSNMKKSDKLVTLRKVVQSLFISFGLATLIISTNFDKEAMSIIINVCLKLIIGLWHIYSASRVANQLVNDIYFSELSEKIYVLDKFEESVTNQIK